MYFLMLSLRLSTRRPAVPGQPAGESERMSSIHIETKLTMLKDRFMARLPQRLQDISDAIIRCEADPSSFRDIERRFHSLAGTSGTYGLTAIAILAAEGESLCSTKSEDSCDPETLAYLGGLIESMRFSAASADKPRERTRILCVEDDPDQALYIQTILEHDDYEVRSVAEASEFDASLAHFQPDLILMDIVFPGADGVNLTRRLREDRTYATLPIIFLTTRRQVESRIEALVAGGDDYLTKPVEPELLRSVVATRLKSSRAMKEMIEMDGLTGVLTHAAFKRRAEAELVQAALHDETVTMVMLDLDHFKSINDRHGHLAGDRVLSEFGSFLKRNVREGDKVGRYGGEEFALLLRAVPASDVQALIRRLIAGFMRVSFRGRNDIPFNVTFSAGMAVLDRRWNLQEWTFRTDEALYLAKNLGRARVEAA
jgi:diguanylate cyclase (GGDEF)-like protein